MRRIHQQVVVCRIVAGTDFLNFPVNAFHGLYKTIQLFEAFTFGGFDHQRTVHGEGEGGCVETVIHKALGNICFADAGFFERSAVENQLVSHKAFGSCIKHGEMRFQTSGQIIGIENGYLGCPFQACCSQHTNIGIGDGQQHGVAVRGRSYRNTLCFVPGLCGQEIRQMGGTTNGACTRTSASVGHGKCFVQIQVANVGSDKTGTGQANLGIHIGSVHINLSAVLMNDTAHFTNVRFENTVGRRISNHATGKSGSVFAGFVFPVFQVDVTVGIAFNLNYGKACLSGTGGIGSVSRIGDKDDISAGLTLGFEIFPDHPQSGIFAGGPGIGLQRTGRKTC